MKTFINDLLEKC